MGVPQTPTRTGRGVKSPVWTDFRLEATPGGPKYRCPGCGSLFSKSSGATYLRRHLSSCLLIQDSPPPGPSIHPEVLAFIIEERLPLAVVERQSIHTITSLPCPHSRKTLKRQIHLEADWLRQKLLSPRDKTYISLLVDGWTNPAGQTLYCAIIHFATGAEVFLEQFYNQGKMDGPWIAGELKRIISSLAPSLIIVTSIVTDNASVLINACDRLDPTVFRNACACHTLNIVLSKWVELERLLEKYRLLAETISTADPSWKPKAYCATRWNSLRIYLQSICDRITDPIHLIPGVVLTADLHDELEIVTAFDCAVTTLEAANATIFDTFEIVMGLRHKLQIITPMRTKFIVQCLDHYTETFLNKSKTFYAAGFLWPKHNATFRGELAKRLSQTMLDIVRLGAKWGHIIDLLTLRSYHSGVLPFVMGTGTATEEWALLAATSPSPQILAIQNIVERFAATAASEAAAERGFSAEKRIHTKERARMGPELVDDLLFLSLNMAQYRAHRCTKQ